MKSLEKLEMNKNTDGTVKRSSLKLIRTNLDFSTGATTQLQDSHGDRRTCKIATPENSPLV
jgi:hypothetical protein